MFREVKWNDLSLNTHYNVKDIRQTERYSGKYVTNNLEFIEGFFNQLIRYQRPFNDAISNWFTYADNWVEQLRLPPPTDDIQLPLKLLFYKTTLEEIQVKDITRILNNVTDNTGNETDKTKYYIDFLQDEEFILDLGHIKTNEINNYQIVAVLFKDVTNEITGETFPYKWFQIIYNKFATSPKKAAIDRIETENAKGPASIIAKFMGNQFVPDFRQTRKTDSKSGGIKTRKQRNNRRTIKKRAKNKGNRKSQKTIRY